MEDIITGFIAIGVACVLILDLAAQMRIRHLSQKIDQILAKVSK